MKSTTNYYCHYCNSLTSTFFLWSGFSIHLLGYGMNKVTLLIILRWDLHNFAPHSVFYFLNGISFFIFIVNYFETSISVNVMFLFLLFPIGGSFSSFIVPYHRYIWQFFRRNLKTFPFISFVPVTWTFQLINGC